MRLVLRSVFTLITSLFAILSLSPTAQAAPMGAEQVGEYFTRYVSVGKGNAEIHVSVKGDEGSAASHDNNDGTFTCRVSGLGILERPNTDEVLLEQKGKFIHEYTHCLVTAYYDIPFSTPQDIEETVARDFVALTEEGISDARALIELFRRDGLLVARKYGQIMRNERMRPEKIMHRTTHAIACAEDVVTRKPTLTLSDRDAFAYALTCGKTGAWKTLQELLVENGHGEIMGTPLLLSTKNDVEASELRTLDAFANGRYRNNSITIHLGYGEYAKGDHHVFIREDGSMEKIDALGTESAQGLPKLQALIASSTEPEHLLAVTALRKHGKLSVRNLHIMTGHFTNFVRVVARKMPGHEVHALRIIEEVITESQIGRGLDPIFNEASKRLQGEFKY